MVYTPYVNNKPDIADAGQDVIDDSRENLEALRDAIMMGKIFDWDMTVTAGGGSASEPDEIAWRYQGTGDLEVRATITWGTAGGSDGNPVTIVYAFTGNRTAGTPTYDTIGTLTNTYDVNGEITSNSWT